AQLGGLCRRARALEQELGDLQRVERRALDEVVTREEEDETVPVRGAVEADAADEYVLGLSRRSGGRQLGEAHARGAGEHRLRVLGLERLLGLDPDRLRMSDEDRDADGRRAERQLG